VAAEESSVPKAAPKGSRSVGGPRRSGAARPARKPGRSRVRVSDPFRFDRAQLADSGEDPAVDLRLAGADEAGRGCLAGPLVVAAVVLDYAAASFPFLEGLTDSKLMTPDAREAIYQGILSSAARVSWTACSPKSIDENGLHKSNLAALARVLESLDGEYRLALVDGFDVRRPDLKARGLVGADYKSAAVAAASVVAKVVRDRLMRALAPDYPEYGFEEHVGYGTEAHRDALRRLGPCPLHRLSFQGVETTQLELWED
jgi:ribonuclease HII